MAQLDKAGDEVARGRVGARGRALKCVDVIGPRIGRETSGSRRPIMAGTIRRRSARRSDESSHAAAWRPRPRVQGERRVCEVGGQGGKDGPGS
jgi:hypothetical protein